MHNRVQQIHTSKKEKGQKKWYVRLFKRLLNAAVHNTFVMYSTKSDTQLYMQFVFGESSHH
jgi:hypothetical protein